jgi:hypothetical protein
MGEFEELDLTFMAAVYLEDTYRRWVDNYHE